MSDDTCPKCGSIKGTLIVEGFDSEWCDCPLPEHQASASPSVRSINWLSEWRGWMVWMKGKQAPIPVLFNSEREAREWTKHHPYAPPEDFTVHQLRVHSDNGGDMR